MRSKRESTTVATFTAGTVFIAAARRQATERQIKNVSTVIDGRDPDNDFPMNRDLQTRTARGFAVGTALSTGGLLCLSSILGGIGHVHVLWSAVSVLGAIGLTAAVWLTIGRVSPSVTERAGWMGLFVVFGQAVDAVSTAVGVDVLSVSEQVPLSRAVLDLAALFPFASTVGVGWLFVVLKLSLAAGLVRVLGTDSDPEPRGMQALFLVAGLAGLIPGIRNLVLYALS